MKILVTGGAGFIGSHVVDRYIADGHSVDICDNLSTGKTGNLNKSARFHQLDIRSSEARSLILSEKYDAVNHHAAQISVVESTRNPINDAENNILGLLNILNAAVESKSVKNFIFISSGGAVYGDKKELPIPETELPQPLSPYAISKLAGEHYVRAICSGAGIDYTTLRYSNVFGPRQDPHGEAGVVAIFSKLMIAGKTPKIFGDGSAVRDYVYVKDVAEANRIALTKPARMEVNVSTAEGTSVNRLFAIMAEIMGFDKKPDYLPKRPGELDRSIIDNALLNRIYNFRPHYSILEGLRETIHYFKMEFGN
jgi:UDP-glucose 4-epimerase